ncbi:MAG: hypothetical protein P8N73_11515 [Pseudomonadales bacterium]|nr:hypothetical protein [Pseudomonadales bacterium]
MTQPTHLSKYRKAKAQDKAKGKTLCASGFHKWQDDAKKQFDVKQGRLVSTKICNRCGKIKTTVG